MIRSCALLCCVVVAAACARPKPTAVPRPDPAERTSVPTTSPTTTSTTSTPPESTSSTPTKSSTPPTPQVSGSPSAHCLYVEPDHRVVRCYWKREDCEQQIAFNKGVMAGSQTCEPVVEAHCFDENGKNQLCYPTAADCDAMVVKMKKRNRPASQCAPKRGP